MQFINFVYGGVVGAGQSKFYHPKLTCTLPITCMCDCAVLYCIVLSCFVLCCAVLRCAMQCSVA